MAARRSTDEMRDRVVLGEFGVRNVSEPGGAGRGAAGGCSPSRPGLCPLLAGPHHRLPRELPRLRGRLGPAALRGGE